MEQEAHVYLMSSRFKAVNKRLEAMDKRFNGMQWMVGGGVVLLAANHDVVLTPAAVRAPLSHETILV